MEKLTKKVGTLQPSFGFFYKLTIPFNEILYNYHIICPSSHGLRMTLEQLRKEFQTEEDIDQIRQFNEVG